MRSRHQAIEAQHVALVSPRSRAGVRARPPSSSRGRARGKDDRGVRTLGDACRSKWGRDNKSVQKPREPKSPDFQRQRQFWPRGPNDLRPLSRHPYPRIAGFSTYDTAMNDPIVLKVAMMCTGCSGAVERVLTKMEGACDI